MSNMSYCRFQNTSFDLADCVNSMVEAYNLEDMGLSESEKKAMNRMRKLCEQFLDEYDRLENADDFDNE